MAVHTRLEGMGVETAAPPQGQGVVHSAAGPSGARRRLPWLLITEALKRICLGKPWCLHTGNPLRLAQGSFGKRMPLQHTHTHVRVSGQCGRKVQGAGRPLTCSARWSLSGRKECRVGLSGTRKARLG